MLDYSQVRRLKKTRRYSKKKLFSTFLIISLIGVVATFLLSIAVFAWFAKDLPNPNRIVRKEGFSTIIYDREGEALYDVYADENRKPISTEDIPKDLKNAVIAIEDKDFFNHEGYSTAGIARSIVKLFMTGDIQGGGSTLTQQLVKNVLLTTEQTLPRKIKEFILAVQIERKYSKDEILTMYLNEAPYGGTAWGVESASEQYFGKPAKDLTLTESAILAGMPQLPSVYSPYSDTPEAYIGRTKDVLRRMREDGYITRDQEKEVTERLPTVRFSGGGSNFQAPHFVMYVKDILTKQFGAEVVEGGGLRVTTTLDAKLQRASEDIMREELEKVKKLDVGNGSAVVIDPQTGEILTMIGSKDYHAGEDTEDTEASASAEGEEENFGGKFNVAVQGLRQPGSALKPFVYATLLQKGYTPSSIIMDVPTQFPGGAGQEPYEPKNYDSKFRGPVQMRYALANSINVTAVKGLALAGVRDMLENGYNMGLVTLEPTTYNLQRFGLAISLGGGEVHLIDLTSAYGVFGAGGVKHVPIAILEVKDKNGKTLFKNQKTKGEQIIEPTVSYLISHILSDNDARKEVFGPNSWLNIAGKTVSVKTGTTDDKRDNWTVGYTKGVVAGVWVGNNDNHPMNPKLASGVTGAAPIWNRIMKEALRTYPDGLPDKPNDIIELEIDAYGGGLPRDGKPTRKEFFIKGTEPTSQSNIYQRLKVSKSDNNKLASDSEVSSGQYDERDFIVLAEDDPVSSDGVNRWQQGIDKWLETINDPLYKYPREKSGNVVNNNPTPTPQPAATETPTPTPTP